MPLHLLSKKSWNVYNTENIARVRRDEAQAKAREEEEERRMQEIDAERRIQILRGRQQSTPPQSPPSTQGQVESHRSKRHGDEGGHYRKRRRLAGENDTDRDIRFAKEDAAMAAEKSLAPPRKTDKRPDDAPIVDNAGHINLFTSEIARTQRVEKNAEAEAEAAKKKREYEDQYTMRFANAAGFKESAGQRPWYSSSAQELVASESMPEKGDWGNEKPGRRERERARICATDPLAAMKKGVQQLREANREREKWRENKTRELNMLKEVQEKEAMRRRHGKGSRPRFHSSLDSLDGFSLDATVFEKTKGGEKATNRKMYTDDHHRPHRHPHRHHRHHSPSLHEHGSQHHHHPQRLHSHDVHNGKDRRREQNRSGHYQKSDESISKTNTQV